MVEPAFDTLAVMRGLESAGVERRQAEAHAEAIAAAARVARSDLATKADLETRIAALEARIYRALWMQAGLVVAAVVALTKPLP